MKGRKLILTFLLISSLTLCACNKDEGETPSDSNLSLSETDVFSEDENIETGVTGDVSSLGETSEVSETEEVIGELPVISVKTSIQSGNYNITLPEFSLSEESSSIKNINESIANFEKAYKILNGTQGENEGIECLTYTFTNYKYATAIVKWKTTPDLKSDGDIYSYVYNGATQRYYTLDRVLYEKGIKEEEISQKFKEYYKQHNVNDEISVISADTQAFRITSSNILELYLKATFSDGISRIYIYTPENENFIPYSDEYMKAMQKFESMTSLVAPSESEEMYKLNGIEYKEKELIDLANQKYIEAYNAVSYLFYGEGTYGKEYIMRDGIKFFKSEEKGFETYDSAIKTLEELFLMPEQYFGTLIQERLYKGNDGTLWINGEVKKSVCLKTGVTEVDSVMDTLAVFKTNSEMENETAISDYFTLITSGNDFKCTYFVYPYNNSEEAVVTTDETSTETDNSEISSETEIVTETE